MIEVLTTQQRTERTTINISLSGIDLGKSAFHVHGVDGRGRVVLQRRFTRTALRRWLSQLPPCRIGIETCSGADHPISGNTDVALQN